MFPGPEADMGEQTIVVKRTVSADAPLVVIPPSVGGTGV
jgi:hypothetical protein